MDFKEILKGQGLTDEQAAAVLSQMDENSIHLASEENLDRRYSKLRADFDQKETALKTAETQISELTGEKETLVADLAAVTTERDELKTFKAVEGVKKSLANEFKVPEGLLEGDTEEALKAQAEKLAPYFKTPAAPKIPGDGLSAGGVAIDERKEVAKQLFGKE